MKSILLIFIFIFLASCSNKTVKESPEDIASIQDDALLSEDLNLDKQVTPMDDSLLTDGQDEKDLSFLEDEIVKTIEMDESRTQNNQVAKVTPTQPRPKPIPSNITEEPKPKNTIVEKTPEASEPIPVSRPKANRQLSSFMIVDNETNQMISIDECAHVVKNARFTEPTCLKRK